MANLRKVQPGDPLAIPADTFNAFVDAAADLAARRHNQARTTGPGGADGTVLVRNDSGGDRARYDVLAITGVVFDPADAEDAFKNTPVLVGGTPADPQDLGRFVVLAAPCAAGAMAPAWIDGVCPAAVVVQNEDHRFADISDGECGFLESRDTGAAAILWKAAGTGQQWAMLQLNHRAEPELRFGVLIDDFDPHQNVTSVDVHPCKRDGTGIDYDTTVAVWVQSPHANGAVPLKFEPQLYRLKQGVVVPYLVSGVDENGDIEGEMLPFVRFDLFGKLTEAWESPNNWVTVRLCDSAGNEIGDDEDRKCWLFDPVSVAPKGLEFLTAGKLIHVGTTSVNETEGGWHTGMDVYAVNVFPGAGDKNKHALLNDEMHTDTVPSAPADGDLIVGNAGGKWEAYGVGGNGAVLVVDNGEPTWLATPGAGAAFVYANAGNGTSWVTVPAGVNSMLYSAGGGDPAWSTGPGSSALLGSDATGLVWFTSSAGSVMIANATAVPTWLAPPTSLAVFTCAANSVPAWTTAATTPAVFVASSSGLEWLSPNSGNASFLTASGSGGMSWFQGANDCVIGTNDGAAAQVFGDNVNIEIDNGVINHRVGPVAHTITICGVELKFDAQGHLICAST
jgi:hypothetical protein